MIFYANQLKHASKKIRGFTLVELVVVIGILAALLSIGTISLSNAQNQSNLSATANTFIADFKEQQIKAMTGDTEGGSTNEDYGIRFGTTSYTLFRGTYGTNNFVVDLPPNTEITSGFPSDEMRFLKGSGEVPGGCDNAVNCRITIKSTNNNSAVTMKVNIYGVISEVVSSP